MSRSRGCPIPIISAVPFIFCCPRCSRAGQSNAGRNKNALSTRHDIVPLLLFCHPPLCVYFIEWLCSFSLFPPPLWKPRDVFSMHMKYCTVPLNHYSIQLSCLLLTIISLSNQNDRTASRVHSTGEIYLRLPSVFFCWCWTMTTHSTVRHRNVRPPIRGVAHSAMTDDDDRGIQLLSQDRIGMSKVMYIHIYIYVCDCMRYCQRSIFVHGGGSKNKGECNGNSHHFRAEKS